jgi:hypothetical protein
MPLSQPPEPFNLHKCLPTGGSLQTGVSDAPPHRPYLHTGCLWGASDTPLGFLANLPVIRPYGTCLIFFI